MENPASHPAAAVEIGTHLTIVRNGPEIVAAATQTYENLRTRDLLTESGIKQASATKAVIIATLNKILDEERLPARERPVGLSPQMRVFNALKKAEYMT